MFTCPNQTETTYQYSDRNELLSLTHTNTQTPAQLQSFLYTYDDSSNRLTKTRVQGQGAGDMATYSYDTLNQLTRQTTGGQAGEFYEYDSLGNRTSAHTSNIYQYDPLM